MRNLCPRCQHEGVELGVVNLQVGRTRKLKSSVKLCPKCGLVFHEKEG